MQHKLHVFKSQSNTIYICALYKYGGLFEGQMYSNATDCEIDVLWAVIDCDRY